MCGIDEAGRGPLAGPLVLAGVVLEQDIRGLNDSKKLTKKRREELFDEIILNPNHVVFISNAIIDEIGLSLCIKRAIEEITSNVIASEYLFDGPHRYGTNVNVMIKADSIVLEVMAASILAKVLRDRFMESLQIDGFSFAKHKGYGTAQHITEIKKNGLCEIHRKSFCKKLL